MLPRREAQIKYLAWILCSASSYCGSKNIRIFSVIVSELELSDVQTQIFLADLMVRSNDASLQDRPEAFNRIGVNCADDILANGVIDPIDAGSDASTAHSRDKHRCRAG